MKLSTRTRYGIRAVIELAECYGHEPLQLKAIAQNQDISIKYLEQIIAMLKSGGFVRSVRGAKGGYILAKAPNQIKLSDVFNCLEGLVNTVECVEDKDYCTRVTDCPARQVWTQVQKAIDNVLQAITLQDLVDKSREKQALDFQI
jgi:Rrf2 family cysteine metabolism transcriptional repressor